MYWVDHQHRDQIDLSDDGPVDIFLRDHFLHWLEALSLMKSTSFATEQLKALEGLLLVYWTSRPEFDVW
jgi:hypothetical protein